MRSIEFRGCDILVDGVCLRNLVREVELPHALREQEERQAAAAPDEEPPPLLAGDYISLPPSFGWPSRHFLGEPDYMAYGQRDGESMIFCCPCGDDGCWALMAKIEVTHQTVRWSGFRNNRRDWDLSALGPFIFSRPDYERSLQRAARQGTSGR
jgi:hypothetical protein